MRLRTAYVRLTICLFLVSLVPAYATDLTVNCQAKKDNSIQSALDSLSKQGPHTITVSGTCNEAVLIEKFDDLTLVTTTGASINDPTPSVPDDNTVVTIVGSRLVELEGFTINGGFSGLACFAHSSCIFLNNTIQGASDFAVLIGRQTTATLVQNTIQNSAGGLQVHFGGAEVVVFGGTIQNITSTTDENDPNFLGYPAVQVDIDGLLRLVRNGVGGPQVVIQNNTFDGITANLNSTLFLQGNSTQISNNGGSGISLDRGAVAEIRNGNQIHNSGGTGVVVGESSFVFVGGGASFSGNTGGDLVCAGTFSNAKGKFPCSNP